MTEIVTTQDTASAITAMAGKVPKTHFPPQHIRDYEALKSPTLLEFGCPEEELCFTECVSIEIFEKFHGQVLTDDLAFPENTIGVVYYHANGSVFGTASFHDYTSFRSSCERIAESLNGAG